MKKFVFLMVILFLLAACGSPAGTQPPLNTGAVTATHVAVTGAPGTTSSVPDLPTATASPTPTAAPQLPVVIGTDNFSQLGVVQIFSEAIDAAVLADFQVASSDYRIDNFAISPDGRYFAVGGCTSLSSATCYNDIYPGHAFLYVIDVASTQVISKVPVDGSSLFGLSFTPDDTRLVYALCPYKGAVWDIAGNKVERVFWQGTRCDSYPMVTVNPDGTQVALVVGQSLLIYDLASGKQVTELPSERHGSILPKYSADGTRLATFITEYGHDIGVYDTGTWKRISMIHVSNTDAAARAVDISPDGSLVAAVEQKESPGIQIFDADTGQRLKLLDEKFSWIESLAFSPDGSLLLVGGFMADVNTNVILSAWDVDSFTWLGNVYGMDTPSRIIFTRDGTALLGGTALWSLPDAGMLAARQALTGVLDNLARGDYAAAAAWYQPDESDLDNLRKQGLDPSDLPAALEALCNQDFHPCMPLHQVPSGSKQLFGEYLFILSFDAPDGSLYKGVDGETTFWVYLAPPTEGSVKLGYLPYFFWAP